MPLRNYTLTRSVQDTSAPVHWYRNVSRHFGKVRQANSRRVGLVIRHVHLSRTESSCFATLRQLRSMRRLTSQALLLSLVVLLVLSRLDYGNAMLAGLPGSQLDRLQSVVNAASRLVCSARKYEHITPLLSDLHWLLRHCSVIAWSDDARTLRVP